MSDLSFEEIAEGREIERAYRLTPDVYEHFLAAFKDENKLHTDADYARAKGFTGKVMHGAILNGFLSHFVGMHFPGEKALLLKVELGYAKPSYLGDELKLKAKVVQKVNSERLLVLRVVFQNETQGTVVASGQTMVRMI
jgi:acyl dehydratase